MLDVQLTAQATLRSAAGTAGCSSAGQSSHMSMSRISCYTLHGRKPLQVACRLIRIVQPVSLPPCLKKPVTSTQGP